ncbi:ribonuclease P protein component [Desulforhabdus amnigena]|uniref:Ribonuclease P protein component n=1 Tax=Desulforhabdus amnigena TaxID=40218 RepID=A0A9W6FVE0_9BACT|nr:ribonuclease P protein component [Desulforhabdus amnigena]NLJ27939.1 ribonuclease P protein component [Deltaproteobacteria bacterium]GLI35605.1 ribonuclease P protein component [Desulforhabdus amnigena]
MKDSYRFRPHEKLRTSQEYLEVKRVGKRSRTTHFGVNFLINGLDYHRLGLIVTKRFWNAVERNRIKRRVREWFRLHKHHIPLPGRDIVIIARQGAERLSSTEVARELLRVFVKQDGRSS